MRYSIIPHLVIFLACSACVSLFGAVIVTNQTLPVTVEEDVMQLCGTPEEYNQLLLAQFEKDRERIAKEEADSRAQI